MPYAPPHACTGGSPGCLRSAQHGERWCAPCGQARERDDRCRRGSARERGYDSRWDRYRLGFLKRHPLCAVCLAEGRTTAANVVDHVVPHRGDERLFWDQRNHQALCDHRSPWNCHGVKTATQDGGFGSAAVRPERLMPSTVPLVAVAGPPGAGKSTWVRERAGPLDLVLDLDEMAARLAGLPLYAANDAQRKAALRLRNARLEQLALAAPPWPRAWLIITAPHPADRRYWREQGGAHVVVLETPLSECLRRIAADTRRGARAEHHARVARSWWASYMRDDPYEASPYTTQTGRDIPPTGVPCAGDAPGGVPSLGDTAAGPAPPGHARNGELRDRGTRRRERRHGPGGPRRDEP